MAMFAFQVQYKYSAMAPQLSAWVGRFLEILELARFYLSFQGLSRAFQFLLPCYLCRTRARRSGMRFPHGLGQVLCHSTPCVQTGPRCTACASVGTVTALVPISLQIRASIACVAYNSKTVYTRSGVKVERSVNPSVVSSMNGLGDDREVNGSTTGALGYFQAARQALLSELSQAHAADRYIVHP